MVKKNILCGSYRAEVWCLKTEGKREEGTEREGISVNGTSGESKELVCLDVEITTGSLE